MVGKGSHSRGLVLVVAAGLLVAACSNGDAEPATTTTPPTTSTTTTSTTAPPTTTTTSTTTTTTTTSPPETAVDLLARPEVLVSNPNRNSIDDFDTTGDDVYRIVVEIFDLFSYLEANPTDSAMDMVTLLAEPDYPYFDVMLEGFLELEENPGWHYVDPGVQLVALDIVAAEDTTATALVVNSRDEQQIADTTGSVVKTYSASALSANEVSFQRGEDGRWRFLDIGPSVPVTQEEIDTMVPVQWTGRES